MNALVGLLILAGLLYGIIIDGTFWKIYGILVTIYLCFIIFYTKKNENPKRKVLLMSTWDCK